MARERKSMMVKIDGKKLSAIYQAYCAEHKMMVKTFCENMGYGEAYIGNACGRGEISRTAVTLLESLYGIKLEEYKYVEPEPVQLSVETPETVEVPETIGSMSKHDFFKMMYKCIYKATLTALEECFGSNGNDKNA